LGGLIPALFWLWFWLREDKKRPEPRGLLFLSFVAGMVMVPIVIPIQRFFSPNLQNITLLTIFLWALIEEVFKFGASYWAALRRKAMDEPIDPMIYLITTALGFAALENTLFLMNSLSSGFLWESVITGNMRFIGATLLHTIASGIVGLFMALSFYKSRMVKKISLFAGLVIAILLHTFFNFFIMNTVTSGVFLIFSAVWMITILLILFFEKVKNIRNIRR